MFHVEHVPRGTYYPEKMPLWNSDEKWNMKKKS
jgi:hypothetical protein